MYARILTLAFAFFTLTTACSDRDKPPQKEAPMSTPTTPTTPAKTGYAPVNGMRLYYEIRGTGDPVILLHGAIGSLEMFGPNIDLLAKTRQVIAVDLQGHGRTADVERPLAPELMADDIAALITHLGFRRADVLGYSLGGQVAINVGIRHPDVVRKLVVVSAVFARSGWYPEVEAQFDRVGQLAEPMKQSPAYAHYAKVAPRPGDWNRMIEKLGEQVKKSYDWMGNVADLPPTLIVAGDADGMRPGHLVEVFAKLGGGLHDPGWDGSAGRPESQLAILPGATHYDIVASPALASVVESFLARSLTAKTTAQR
jgi:pimeloyl-ACP methyl ester carboxylesterase